MNTIEINSGNTKMIAHRGLSGLETENSIQAFIAAGNRSYYGVETDVHVTKDGKFIIIHDDCTDRVSEDSISIENSSYALVRKLQLKDMCPAAKAMDSSYQCLRDRQDLVIPNLKEYVSICKKYEKKCVLELKNEFAPEDIGRMVEEIRALNYLDHIIFISFSLNNMIILRQLLPEQELQYLTGEYNEQILQALKEHHLYLDIYYRALTKEIVERLHEEGILVNCWTCDNKEEGEQLVKWGVDYITSNILE